MVAPKQVEIPFSIGVGRQRGRGFGALAQVIGRTAIPFLCKFIVPTAKRVGSDLLEFAVPEFEEVVSSRKNFKTAAKSVGRQTLRKLLGSGSRERTTSRVLPAKSAKQTSRSRRDFFYKRSSLIKSSNFLYQPFVAFSGNIGEKFPVVDEICHPTNKKSILLSHSLKIA